VLRHRAKHGTVINRRGFEPGNHRTNGTGLSRLPEGNPFLHSSAGLVGLTPVERDGEPFLGLLEVGYVERH
jgi:hypothetical protein